MAGVEFEVRGRSGGHPSGMPSLRAVSDPSPQCDRLVPLLRELVTAKLVVQTVDGKFELSDAVQTRLHALTADRPPPSAQVYVGRRCELCGVIKVTRMVDGLRTCTTCHERACEPYAEPATQVSDPRRMLHPSFRWHRGVG